MNFNILPSETILKSIVDFGDDGSHTSVENLNFSQMGYDSRNLLLNVGSLIIFASILVIVIVLLFVCKPLCRKCRFGTIVHSKISQAIFFNIIIRYFMETYMEYMISAMMNFKELNFKSTGETISSLSSIIAIIFGLFGPIVIFIFLI